MKWYAGLQGVIPGDRVSYDTDILWVFRPLCHCCCRWLLLGDLSLRALCSSLLWTRTFLQCHPAACWKPLRWAQHAWWGRLLVWTPSLGSPLSTLRCVAVQSLLMCVCISICEFSLCVSHCLSSCFTLYLSECASLSLSLFLSPLSVCLSLCLCLSLSQRPTLVVGVCGYRNVGFLCWKYRDMKVLSVTFYQPYFFLSSACYLIICISTLIKPLRLTGWQISRISWSVLVPRHFFLMYCLLLASNIDNVKNVMFLQFHVSSALPHC